MLGVHRVGAAINANGKQLTVRYQDGYLPLCEQSEERPRGCAVRGIFRWCSLSGLLDTNADPRSIAVYVLYVQYRTVGNQR